MSPTAAYWNPTVLRQDTRIPALGQDTSEYEFLAPSGGGPLRISARLVFRRAFRTLSSQKSWNDPDILMKQVSAALNATAPGTVQLSVLHAATMRSGVPLAPSSIATVYGSGLSNAGSITRAVIRDRQGLESDAQLLYVSPGQLNLVLPGAVASGAAVLKVLRDSQVVAATQVTLARVAPGLFSANGLESGPAAAIVATVAPDGSQTISPTYSCSAGICSTAVVSAGSGATRSYLSLFGTGIRGAASNAEVKVAIAGIDVPVITVDPQSQCAGLDQVNVELPSSLAGKGDVPVILTVAGVTANTVLIRLR